MNDPRKSDGAIVPKNLPNKPAMGTEAGEGRAPTEQNTAKPDTPSTQRREHGVPSGLDRVREAASRDKGTRFTALLHHVTLELLAEVYWSMNRKAAPGVDGETWRSYGEQLWENLTDLLARVQRGAYRAKPSRRVYIPKADGKQRPLGVAALEDKILQGAVATVMNAIYERDFYGYSYGFRPGRGAHDALDALATAITTRKVNWVLDADIRSFFDSLDHTRLMELIEHRIGDPRLQRLIQKWLNAGVLEEGRWQATEMGTPQGATLSPLLANIYLHYALDVWVHAWRQQHARGEVYFTRYADDFVVCFQHQSDAIRFHADLRQRLAEYALTMHEDKTRLIEFGRFAASNRADRQAKKPETFDFLGFTHICGRSRAGRFQLRRKPIAKRMRAKLQAIKLGLRRRMHWKVKEQALWLSQVLRGYFQYFAVPTSYRSLAGFRRAVIRLWYHTLHRRSQRTRTTWERMYRLTNALLPTPKILHPWPDARFSAKHAR